MRCFKGPVRTLRNVCGEQTRLRPAPKLRPTRNPKPTISGLPKLGGPLARRYEFQGSLGRFISFNKDRRQAIQLIPTSNVQTTSSVQPQFLQTISPAQQDKTDLLDWFASISDRIRPYSARSLRYCPGKYSCRDTVTVCRRLGIH
jgi:hypothetical protein